MKRWIIYTLLTVFSIGLMPEESLAGGGGKRKRERGEINKTLLMSPKQLSKHSAKLRKDAEKNRERQLQAIKRSQSKSKK